MNKESGLGLQGPRPAGHCPFPCPLSHHTLEVEMGLLGWQGELVPGKGFLGWAKVAV